MVLVLTTDTLGRALLVDVGWPARDERLVTVAEANAFRNGRQRRRDVRAVTRRKQCRWTRPIRGLLFDTMRKKSAIDATHGQSIWISGTLIVAMRERKDPGYSGQ
jgi:hypothetical protein